MRTRSPEQIRNLLRRLVRRIPKRPPAPSVKRRATARIKIEFSFLNGNLMVPTAGPHTSSS
jgi:hypothetical protein